MIQSKRGEPVLLCIESSTAICSVSLAVNNVEVATVETDSGYNHASVLALFVEKVLRDAGLSADDIDAVAVSGGPGSYTGLRIGISTAKGICYALEKPLIALSALESMAMELARTYVSKSKEQVILIPMIDARRMEVYCGVWDNRLEQMQPVEARIINEHFLDSYKDAERIVLCGDGAKKCFPLFKGDDRVVLDSCVFPSAKFMIPLAIKKFIIKDFESVAYYVPLYLKDFIAAKPVVKGLF
jgi:tRNA threonylcarbamoyladenosine biosynthesis protein TsaB